MKEMSIEELNNSLNKQVVDFTTTMAFIEENYQFTPTKFINGKLINEQNTNNGSCKIFAYGKLNNLSQQATLNAFGDFYAQDVLGNPTNNDHANIRNFMQTAWQGIEFFGEALKVKSSYED